MERTTCYVQRELHLEVEGKPIPETRKKPADAGATEISLNGREVNTKMIVKSRDAIPESNGKVGNR